MLVAEESSVAQLLKRAERLEEQAREFKSEARQIKRQVSRLANGRSVDLADTPDDEDVPVNGTLPSNGVSRQYVPEPVVTVPAFSREDVVQDVMDRIQSMIDQEALGQEPPQPNLDDVTHLIVETLSQEPKFLDLFKRMLHNQLSNGVLSQVLRSLDRAEVHLALARLLVPHFAGQIDADRLREDIARLWLESREDDEEFNDKIIELLSERIEVRLKS